MHITHIVVDDFFPEPDRVRAAALALPYPPRPAGEVYPGRNAAQALQIPGVERVVSDIAREQVVPIHPASHCVPRLALEGDTAGVSVHIDPAHWSGIVCLSLDEHCREGTHFFRHKETGLDRAPVFDGEPEQLGYADRKAAVDDILDRGKHDLSQWERILSLPMRYNRLILFRSYVWHDAGVSFGTTPETGRLILPMFFSTPAANV